MRVRRGQPGFTLIEALISLALMGLMLAAIATAIHGSMLSYQENNEIAAMTQSARWILSRMMSDVRRADAVDSTGQSLRIVPPDTGDGLQLVEYELSAGVLHYRRTVNGETTSYVLLGSTDEVSVTAFTVLQQTATKGETTYTESVTARLDLACDNQTFSVTASAAPRRNQDY